MNNRDNVPKNILFIHPKTTKPKLKPQNKNAESNLFHEFCIANTHKLCLDCVWNNNKKIA